MEAEGSRSEDMGRSKTGNTCSEESLGSSSSSSVLNSWTILPVTKDKEKEKEGGLEKNEDLTDLRTSSQADKQKNERCNRPAAEDPHADDISDGISIISDCESTDRISPNLFLREPLVDLGFGELPPSPACSGQQLKEYPEQEQEDSATVVRSKLELQLPPLVQNGLTAFFYVAATLAILAFVGKLRHPEWQVLGEYKPLAELERRVGDLELQNNLLRAEIDIMSKKLQYLGSGQDAVQRQGRLKGKTFKAWPGNGDTVSPVDITKEDLKQPFQCPDGQFVEIAGMCLENNRVPLDALTDEIGNAVNDVLQQSGAFQKFEKVTEKLRTFASDNEDVGAAPGAKDFKSDDGPEAATSHGQPKLADGSKERFKPRYKQGHSHERKQRRQEQVHDRRSRQEEHSKEHGKNKYYDQSSRDRYNKNVKKPIDHSDENSKQRDLNNDSGSGEWHERMMQQRENARHKHAQKRNNNNWYIERGDSREQMRSGETQR
ncbi:uncharacterized protein LOC128265204 [Drosophila gunungcola]|uniref:Uncharacterized protein n=1 Tax=Drosophila gunungcola TaxID=103775 RepID=A0A9P9YB92_9MUSC|nr:uncharacterized protein LOC128265204 [Drosophila gunungcola]XP_052857036.1 uncharacterized protein LOC128265204 [Drosophila gunungcola]XP_052857037.1 uncharacterized protein LOC128265204 [Drosophila gunungcola]XP_052857038.1 uncharacterized protein LOC128265204 [Drosophila gunungcola]KAI8033781.1 hypothetical protein M5D96_013451 [Drosophila gunungcola]